MDFRLAVREIRRRPLAFASISIAVGLAIAICASMFSIVDGLLFRPLPFKDAEQILAIDYPPVGGRQPLEALLPAFSEHRRQLRERLVNSGLTTQTADTHLAVFFDGYEAEQNGLTVQVADRGFFDLFGFKPAAGALFSEDDERTSSVLSATSSEPLPIIIGNALSQRLSGTPDEALGTRTLAGRRVRIVGVMPEGVKFPGETNVWVAAAPKLDRMPSFVRLATGASADQLSSLAPELRFRTLRGLIYPSEAEAAFVLLGAASLLLLVTWIQVAASIFSWSMEHTQSAGIRLALGASRVRILRQRVLTTGVLIAAATAVAGGMLVPVTWVIVNRLPPALTTGQYLQPDFRTVTVLTALMLVSFVAVSAAAALAQWRVSPADVIAQRLPGLGRVGSWGRRMLIGQVAATAALLYVAGLASHSFERAITLDLGFDIDHILVVNPPRPSTAARSRQETLRDNEAFKQRLNQSMERVSSLPTVRAVASVFSGPFGLANQPPPRQIESLDGRPLEGQVRAIGNAVSTRFVAAVGAHLVQGQSFDAPEFQGREDVALINETLARQLPHFAKLLGGNELPSFVGRRFTTVDGQFEIVGVIKDFVDTRLGMEARPQYFSHDPRSLASAILFVRLDDAAQGIPTGVREALEVDLGKLPDRCFSKLSDTFQPLLAPYKSQALLLGAVSLCCMPVAALGLISAVSNSVRTRTREFGVRLALGAEPATIRRSVLVESLTTTSAGILIGSALGAATGHVTTKYLFGVSPIDLASVLIAAVLLTTIAVFASALQSRTISNLAPAEVLRQP